MKLCRVILRKYNNKNYYYIFKKQQIKQYRLSERERDKLLREDMYLWRETLCNCPSWSLVINGLVFLHLHLFFNIQTNSLNFIFGICIFSPPNVLSNDTNDTNEIVSLSDQLHMYVIHIKFWLFGGLSCYHFDVSVQSGHRLTIQEFVPVALPTLGWLWLRR